MCGRVYMATNKGECCRMVVVGYGDDIPVCPLADKVCVQTDKHPYLCFSFPAYCFFNRSIHFLKDRYHFSNNQ